MALGIVVGRSGGGEDNSALIEALRKQAATSTTASLPSAGAATGATGKGGKAAAKGKAKGTDATGGKVVANTDHGVVHEITNYKPAPKKVEEDTKQVEEIATEGGADYIKTQKNLPDVITVGGDPDSAPPLPSGAEP